MQVLVVGNGDGVKGELTALGIESVHTTEILGGRHAPMEEINGWKPDPAVRAVIVGIDLQMTYTKLA